MIKLKRSDRLDYAEREEKPIDIKCDLCGKSCQATGKPIPQNAVMVLTPDIALIASRYCKNCNIVMCGRCIGVSQNERGPITKGRVCPQCGQEISFAIVSDLRKTTTKLA